MATTNTLVARRHGSTFTCTITTSRATQTHGTQIKTKGIQTAIPGPKTKKKGIQTEPSHFHDPKITPSAPLDPNGYKLALVHFHPDSFSFPNIQDMFRHNYMTIFAQHSHCFMRNTRCTRTCPYLGTLPSSAYLAPLQLRGTIETSGTFLEPHQLPTCSFDYSTCLSSN